MGRFLFIVPWAAWEASPTGWLAGRFSSNLPLSAKVFPETSIVRCGVCRFFASNLPHVPECIGFWGELPCVLFPLSSKVGRFCAENLPSALGCAVFLQTDPCRPAS